MRPTRNRRHLSDVRSLPCCLRMQSECSGEVQAHHAFNAGTGGGMAMKGSDLATVPLCAGHHHKVHSEPVPLLWRAIMAAGAIGLACNEAAYVLSDDFAAQLVVRAALEQAVRHVVTCVEEQLAGRP